MTRYRLVADPRADLDIAATFEWYENEQAGLGQEFLAELRATYDRVGDAPLQYQHLRSAIRRALLRRFPHLYVLRAVERGQADAATGRTISHEEVETALRRKWLRGGEA